jgi:hypothetical protein
MGIEELRRTVSDVKDLTNERERAMEEGKTKKKVSHSPLQTRRKAILHAIVLYFQ